MSVKKRKRLGILPLCLFWFIWRERNRKVFQNCENLDETIFIYLGFGLDCTMGMRPCLCWTLWIG